MDVDVDEDSSTSVYTAVAKRDAAGMAAGYADDATFSDPVFPGLDADGVRRLEVEASVNNPDARTMVLQGIPVEVDEGYGHCPRSINFAKLWDVDNIQANGAAQRIVNPGNKLEPARSGVPDP